MKKIFIILTFIYSFSLPFYKPLALFLQKYAGYKGFAYILFIVIFISFLVYIFNKFKRDVKRLIIFIFVNLILALFIIFMGRDFPIEKFHILEYLLLGIMIELSFFDKYQEISFEEIFFFIILGILFSINDELIQGIISNRVYDTNDIIMNIQILMVSFFYGRILFFEKPFSIQRKKDYLKLTFNKKNLILFIEGSFIIFLNIIIITMGKNRNWEDPLFFIKPWLIVLNFQFILFVLFSFFYDKYKRQIYRGLSNMRIFILVLFEAWIIGMLFVIYVFKIEFV